MGIANRTQGKTLRQQQHTQAISHTMSLPSRVTRSTLSNLYNTYRQTAQSFQSYNFREYFLRVSDRKFGEELGEVLGGSSKLDLKALAESSAATSSSSSSAEEDLLASVSQEQKERLRRGGATHTRTSN